jgi:hypothetical protein
LTASNNADHSATRDPRQGHPQVQERDRGRRPPRWEPEPASPSLTWRISATTGVQRAVNVVEQQLSSESGLGVATIRVRIVHPEALRAETDETKGCGKHDQ